MASRIRDGVECDDDAALADAAPGLLAACQQVLAASEDNGDMDDIDWGGLRAAIALATARTVAESLHRSPDEKGTARLAADLALEVNRG